MASVELKCRVVATREPDSRLWSFYLVNDGESAIESAALEAVKYEWGDQYHGGESPDVHVTNLAAGERALVWKDDGSSEMRTDLWLRFVHSGEETFLLFEFPKLYRQTGTTLIAEPVKVSGPPQE